MEHHGKEIALLLKKVHIITKYTPIDGTVQSYNELLVVIESENNKVIFVPWTSIEQMEVE